MVLESVFKDPVISQNLQLKDLRSSSEFFLLKYLHLRSHMFLLKDLSSRSHIMPLKDLRSSFYSNLRI